MEVECTSYFSTSVHNVDLMDVFDWHSKLPRNVKVTVDPEHPVIHGELYFKATWLEKR